jgi:hypothetical protein
MSAAEPEIPNVSTAATTASFINLLTANDPPKFRLPSWVTKKKKKMHKRFLDQGGVDDIKKKIKANRK